MRAAAALALALLALVPLPSCAPRAGTGTGAASAANAPTTAIVPSVGLQLTRWYIPLEPKPRAGAIAHARELGLLEPVESGAEAAGLLVFRSPVARLTELAEALGGSPQVHSTLLGALPEWADTEVVRIEGGRTVFLAGRPKVMGASLFKFWLRGWTFPTVDGARARIEFRLTLEDERGERLTLDPTSPRTKPKEIAGSRTIGEFRPEEALVILEKPIVPPDEDESDPLAVLPPPTLAALLLAERGIEGRATVLVVTAGFADILSPSAAPAAAEPPR